MARDRDALLVAYLERRAMQSADVTVPPLAPVATARTARAPTSCSRSSRARRRSSSTSSSPATSRPSAAVIQRELQHPGQARRSASEELTESRRKLSALGLFRRIQISAVCHGDPSLRDVIVSVEEAQQTTIDYGGGLAGRRRPARERAPTRPPTSVYEFAPRGFFEIGRRNLGGKNRSVNLYTRFGLRPNTRSGTSRNPFGFSEYRVVGTYREPRALSNYGDLTATAAVEQGVRTGFNFARKGFNAELTHRDRADRPRQRPVLVHRPRDLRFRRVS